MTLYSRVLDASDPGTGKTRVQVELISSRYKKNKKKALVIAPKSLLTSTWKNEFATYAPQIRTSVATAANRPKAFQEDADVYITNIDATVWLAKQSAKFFANFDTLIIDESSAFKHRTSMRSKALNKIKKYFHYRYALTGTPNSNSITDIWHQIFILDDGKRLGKSFFRFRNSVCEPKQVGPHPNAIQWTDKPGIELVVASLLADMTVRHVFEECISIPEDHCYSVPYTLSGRQRIIYKQMEDDTLLQLNNGAIVSAINAAGVRNKLLQIASGASYSNFDPNNTNYSLIDTGRYELVADLVDQRAHSIVFYIWIHQRDLLVEEFKRRGISYVALSGNANDKDRAAAVKNFQNGLYRVFLAHPINAAHGLTLTKANTTIWPSPTYNLEHWVQGNRRIRRPGQLQKTETITVIAEDTIEDYVLSRLNVKDEHMASTLDILGDYFRAWTESI